PRIVWFSAVVCLSPKFNKEYFHFSTVLLWFVVAEWVVGVMMLIMYLVFIASKYGFVKVLLGI
ncbi:MAG: hypothetical protein MUF71_18910, partial [Candidatus Kapabacteria bacterium]|nr:hypothetical protein [Candidatus Kapabacteria bacterium]